MKKIMLLSCLASSLIAAEQKRAIVFGATSVLGKSMVMKLLDEGYAVAACDLGIQELKQLKEKTGHTIFVRRFKAMHAKAKEELDQLMHDMGGVPDLVIVNDSVILQNEKDEFDWERQYRLLRVNVIGYAALIQYFVHRWHEQEVSGHFVSVVQVDNTRHVAYMPFSNASTEFITMLSDQMAEYHKEKNQPVYFTTVSSDWDGVEEYAQNSLDQSVQTIMDAVQDKKAHVQISKHWHLISMLMKIMPEWLYKAVGGQQ